MSDDWLIIVPADPFASPADEAVAAAAGALRGALPDADEVRVERTPNPHFVDAGANLQSVACPACGTALDDWWTSAMERAQRDDFRELAATVPCCGHRTTLNDLAYNWPQAFARVSIEAMNPNVGELDPRVKDAVESGLGVPVRIVWQHL